MKKKLLFVCSANISRSPTAENIFKDSEDYEAKSAGIIPDAVKIVSQNLIDWADIIFVMSETEGHLSFIKKNFNITGKKIFDLEIPNDYQKDDPLLIKLLKDKISNYLGD